MISDEATGEALDAHDAETAEELDEVTEAVAQSPEDSGVEEAVDEPAPVDEEPETVEADTEVTATESVSEANDSVPEVPDEEQEPKRRSHVAWWPFIVYGLLWLGLLGASYLLLTGAQTELPAFRQDAYPYLVLAGLVLTLLGPIMSLAVWLLGWFKAGKGDRGGLLTTALVRGALVTFLGVALWWGMLVLVDALRLGLV